MKQNTVIILVLVFLVMNGILSRTKENSKAEEKLFNGKSFIIPRHNLYGWKKDIFPKLDNPPVHLTFFSLEVLEPSTKKNIDPKTLNNLQNQEKKEEHSTMIYPLFLSR